MADKREKHEQESEELSFYDHLALASRVYDNLRKTKLAHAASKAVKAENEKRKAYFQDQGPSRVITPSLWPYQKHYMTLLPRLAPCAFLRQPSKTFVDIGSAPGGMCVYLCKKLKWSGVAISLPEIDGGFKMTFRHGKCKFFPHDVSEPNAWKDLLQITKEHHPHRRVGDESDVTVEDNKVEMFDFINLGITLQWQPPSPSCGKSAENEQESKRKNDTNGDTVDGDSDESSATLPWNNRNHRLCLQEIIRNELLFALQAIKHGGSIMVTLPTSDHPNTFLYLSYLRKCSKRKIRIVPTPKITRNPVYVLVQQINKKGKGVTEFIRFLKTTEVHPENDSQWQIGSWEEAKDTYKDCRFDLDRLWARQSSQLQMEL